MTNRSLVALSVLLILCTPARAADLVNINMADSATLQTLNGIGPSKAQAIIDYRTQNGPFTSIDQIQNVSGIGVATYNNIKDYITVGGGASQTPTENPQTASSSTSPGAVQDTSLSAGVVPALPMTITAQQAIVGAGTAFEGKALSSTGAVLGGARYLWNFGDGTTAEGSRVMHTYAYPGTYEVVLSGAYNYTSGTVRLAVEALAANVSLLAEGDGSLTVGNLSSEDLDVGRWALVQGTNTFVIPEHTIVLAGKGVRFPPATLGFMGGMQSSLFYPNGARAAYVEAGRHSPLRGQTVELPKKSAALPAQNAPAQRPQGTAAEAQTNKGVLAPAGGPAAVALGVSSSMWSYLLGLVAVIALGAIGAYYARMSKVPAETRSLADEFEIE